MASVYNPAMPTLLKRIDPEQHINRWYFVTVQPTLFHPVAVITAWGSRENDYQRVKILPAASTAAAAALAKKIVATKVKRGYEVVSL